MVRVVVALYEMILVPNETQRPEEVGELIAAPQQVGVGRTAAATTDLLFRKALDDHDSARAKSTRGVGHGLPVVIVDQEDQIPPCGRIDDRRAPEIGGDDPKHRAAIVSQTEGPRQPGDGNVHQRHLKASPGQEDGIATLAPGEVEAGAPWRQQGQRTLQEARRLAPIVGLPSLLIAPFPAFALAHRLPTSVQRS